MPNNSLKRALLATSVVVAALLVAGCQKRQAQPSSTPPWYAEEIEEWRAGRIERLKSPTGYLSLVGLYWLEEGDNTFGADPSNDLVFPKGSPDFIGTFHVQAGRVSVDVEPGVQVTLDGAPVVSVTMRHDLEGRPTVLDLGTMSWFVIMRGGQLGVRVRDTESRLRRNFEGISAHPVSYGWRVVGTFHPYDPPLTHRFTSVLGMTEEEPCAGALVFELDGEKYSLDVIGKPGDERYFVIFGDTTNGHDTYGGGRFLYVDAPGEDGKVIIDFNKAYNPPCAFSEYTTCLLPLPQNRLPIAVTAGEKAYGKVQH